MESKDIVRTLQSIVLTENIPNGVEISSVFHNDRYSMIKVEVVKDINHILNKSVSGYVLMDDSGDIYYITKKAIAIEDDITWVLDSKLDGTLGKVIQFFHNRWKRIEMNPASLTKLDIATITQHLDKIYTDWFTFARDIKEAHPLD